MESAYPILIDLGVLGFFGFLFYFLQRRKILRNSTYEIKNRLQKLIFDLHVYLDGKNEQVFYSELNTYALTLESTLKSENILKEKDSLIAPASLPEELSQELSEIMKLF